MLVHRWAILRSAMPQNISIKRTIALVNALAKLQNFCIDRKEASTQLLAGDTSNIVNSTAGYVPMENSENERTNDQLPRQIIGGGEHFGDFPRDLRRRHDRAEHCPGKNFIAWY